MPLLTAKKLGKIGKKRKNRGKKEEKSGRKGKYREGSYTLPLLTDRAGYGTALNVPFLPQSRFSRIAFSLKTERKQNKTKQNKNKNKQNKTKTKKQNKKQTSKQTNIFRISYICTTLTSIQVTPGLSLYLGWQSGQWNIQYDIKFNFNFPLVYWMALFLQLLTNLTIEMSFVWSSITNTLHTCHRDISNVYFAQYVNLPQIWPGNFFFLTVYNMWNNSNHVWTPKVTKQ